MTGLDVKLDGNSLCSIDDVKTVLRSKIESDQYDNLIAILIMAFSTLAEKFCNRLFEIKERDELFSASRLMPVRNYRVKAPPIMKVPEPRLFFDVNRQFPPSSELSLGNDFVVSYDAGVVTLVSQIVFEAGWGELSSRSAYAMGSAKAEISFSTQSLSTKLVYTGGLVVPRPAAPNQPTLSLAGPGLVSGQRFYRIGIISGGKESIASSASVISCSNNSVQISFANPGTGKTVVVYRSEQNNQKNYRLVGSVAGSAAPPVLSLIDNAADSALPFGDPKAYGPIEVPADLRFACAQQCVEWFNKSESPTVVDVRGGYGSGGLRFDKPSDLLPTIRRILSGYVVYREI